MKIFCMSDIHGCLAEFEDALSLVIEHLEEKETMLILMGDYIHGGADNYGVLDKIMKLQNQYGSDKVLALMGNHEEFVLWGESTINHMIKTFDKGYNMAKEGNNRRFGKEFAYTALKFTGFDSICLSGPINASKTQYI